MSVEKNMRQKTVRLKPGQFLKEEIEKLVRDGNIKAGVLLSMVGGLENVKLRMPGAKPENQVIKEWNDPFEIVAGTGTLSKDGCMVKTTAEIVMGIFDDVIYKRVLDQDTGFEELEVE